MRSALATTLPRLVAGLLLAAGLSAGLSACAEKAQKALDPHDELLLGQLQELAEIRILAQEYPDSAQARLDSFLAHNDTTEIHERIRRVEEDPARGRFLLKALHDSLLVPLQRASRRNSSPPVPRTSTQPAKPRN